MTDRWQVTFTVPDQADIITEMLEASLDVDLIVESMSIHRDDDHDPWFVMLITLGAPDKSHLNNALNDACRIAGQPQAKAHITPLPTRDWLAENRKSFPPLDIGRFWIYGDYVNDPVPAGKIGLKIDAGQAFGSGSHATTYGCIMMLEKHCPDGGGLSIADIGCGSGILAMAAAKICSDAKIVAVDNDPLSVDTTRDNAAENGVGAMISVDLSDGYKARLVQENAPYDVILANILPTPLIEMAQDASQCLPDDGVLILSGLLEDQQKKVAEAYVNHGLKLLDSLTHNGWSTLVMGKMQ